MDILEDLTDPSGERDQKDRLLTWVAICVVILACFMSVCNVKADNIAQAMIQVKSDELDQWNFFQAKSTKENLAEVARDQIRVLKLGATAASLPEYEKMEHFYSQEAKRYTSEKGPLKEKAESLGVEYERLNDRDDQFDLSDAVMQIALALFGLTALTNRRWLFGIAAGVAAFGMLVGGAGLLNVDVHLKVLTQLLGT